MKEHNLKFKGKWLCDVVYERLKTCEIRKNDRDYHVGDLIHPIAIDDDYIPFEHPINDVTYQITYIAYGAGDLIKRGYCVFSMRPVPGTDCRNEGGSEA